MMQRPASKYSSANATTLLYERLGSQLRHNDQHARLFIDPHFGHDFGRVSIHVTDSTRSVVWRNDGLSVLGSHAMLYEESNDGETNPTEGASADTGSLATPGNAETEDSGVVPTQNFAGSEVQTGATYCDAATGKAVAKTLNTNECTSGCSTKHEEKHAADIGPCCAKAGVASKAATTEADKAAVQKKFDDWMITNRPRLECDAYAVSVSCGEAKHKKEGCEHSVRPTCCKPLVWYIRGARMEGEVFCNHADKKLSACPFP